MGTSVVLPKVLTVRLRATVPSRLLSQPLLGNLVRPAVSWTFNDISSGVGPYWVGPSPSTLDASPVLGVFRFEPCTSTTIASLLWSRAIPVFCSASSLAGDGRCSHSVPSRGSAPLRWSHVVAFPPTASQCSQFALLCRVSNTSRVLSPSSRSATYTSQAFSILAPPMGFCLQRSVHVPGRTPFGWPCPAFP